MSLDDLRVRYPRLTTLSEPTTVEWRGETRNVDTTGCQSFDQSGACKQPVITADVSSGGTALLAEYFVEGPYEGYSTAFRLDDTGGVLAPIIIDVCAQFSGQGDRAIPDGAAKSARVCAVRAYHHTYLDEYRDKDETHSNTGTDKPMYELVFQGLVGQFGYPQQYHPRGKIVIELADGTQLTSDPRPRYVDYHWGRGTSDVSIDYAFNPKDGLGMVYVSNSVARFYAEQRHEMGDTNFLLWRIHQKGGMNRHEFVPHYQNGSLAQTQFDARVEKSRVSSRVKALFAAHQN